MNVLGERRTLLVGLAGFGVASALGGAAPAFATLIAARALQGVFAAVLMPTTLAVLTNTFRDPGERGKAFGIFGSIAGAGASVGLLLGGALTASVDWRWTLYVNLAFAALGVLGTVLFVAPAPPERSAARGGVDWAGTALSALASLLVVLGSSSAEGRGWSSAATVLPLAAAAAAYLAFIALERRVANPVLPLQVVVDRTRGASLIVLFLAGGALYATFLTYYFQRVLGLDPIQSGLAFLPRTLSSITVATLGGIFLLRRVSGRLLMPAGLVIAAAGLLMLGRISTSGDYASVVLPALVLLGGGLAPAFTVAFGLGLAGVDPRDAGAASAAVNAVRQIGGSIGSALLNTVAASVTASAAAAALARTATSAAGTTSASRAAVQRQAAVQGYSAGSWISAAALLAAALVAAALVRPARPSTTGTGIQAEQTARAVEVTTAVS